MLDVVEPLPGSVATLAAILEGNEPISPNARRMLVTVIRTLEQRTATAQRQRGEAEENVLRIRDEANAKLAAQHEELLASRRSRDESLAEIERLRAELAQASEAAQRCRNCKRPLYARCDVCESR